MGHSGLNVWVPIRGEAVVVQRLHAAGWAVAPGEGFRLQTPPAIRITTSTLEPDDAARGVEDLRSILSPDRSGVAA